MAVNAFGAEAAALTAVAAGLTAADLRRPSPCPPWIIADLLGHVIVAAGRVDQAIAAARGAGPERSELRGRPDRAAENGGRRAGGRALAPLITAAGYYRPDQRFSPAVNADRVKVAAALAARLGTPAAIAAELAATCQRSLALLADAPPGLEVRTRHGDRMLASEFAVTRVVELAVHGLDLAIGLDREPWLTSEAADVLEDLMLPDASTAGLLRARFGCDRAGLIARLTGRIALGPADRSVLAGLGLSALPLG